MLERREREVSGGGARLRGAGVVVTRPAHQAERLVRLLEDCGARVIRFPTLEIVETTDPAPMLAVIERLRELDLAVFVSPNAVAGSIPHIVRAGGIPAGLTIAAVGQGTARALAEHGVRVDLRPGGSYDSEALLALPALQGPRIAGQRVVLFCGEGGREVLAQTLAERGARVERAEAYRRVRPQVAPETLLGPMRRGEVNVIVTTSGEGLRNLFEMVDEAGRERLRSLPLVVVSGRTAALARRLGARRAPVVAERADDASLLEAVVRAYEFGSEASGFTRGGHGG